MMQAAVGVLLAAGRGRRYDASGRQLKLLASAASGPHAGAPLAVAAARTLRAALPQVIAVVRAGYGPPAMLRDLLAAEGCALCVRSEAEADRGVGASLAAGVRHSAEANGWVIALGDMPALRPETVAAVAAALESGAATAAVTHGGTRGHPVGFAAALREELLALDGDTGARAVLQRHPPRLIEVSDPGVLVDVDTAA